MINNKNLEVEQFDKLLLEVPMSVTQKLISLIVYVSSLALSLYCFLTGNMLLFLCSLFISCLLAYIFYVASIKVVVKLPESPTGKLYKIGKRLFIGANNEEAKLFSEIISNKEEIKELKSGIFYFDK
jgi:predicted neutral ceramidase superfamily lipid hydrolase